ncbi:MAG: hypothetical protein IAF58_16540 [Leptolyngbya sp.]|nr:hypothetical protein [Candidatus Melainabacteria bacterium]
MENVREVASAVYDASEQKGNDNVRQQAVDLLSEPANQTDAAKAAISQQLEATGTLPQLVISEFENLDGDNNGTISEQELETITADAGTDALTKMAAEYAKENFYGISDVDDSWGSSLFDNNELDMNEVNQFRDQARADRDLEPSEMYRADRVINNQTPETELTDLLTRNASSPEQQLKAVEAMLAQGKTSFQMTDLDGNQYDVTINVQDLGNGVKVIGLLGNDDGGTYPILRGVSRNGVYSQQQNSNGPVDWYGTKWQQNHPDSAFAP